MTRALEKIAGREGTRADAHRGEVVCRRCGMLCIVPAGARLEETACVGCIRRLGGADRSSDGVHAIRVVAEWPDRSVVAGPGYGLVGCPHCATECVVEVGGASRTACAVCLRALGTVPLVRMDLMARARPLSTFGVAAAHDMRDAEPAAWTGGDEISCVFLPGELR